MTPGQATETRWGLDDLAVMTGAVVPALFASLFLKVALKGALPGPFQYRVVEAFSVQTVFYLLTLAALYFVVSIKHQEPFWAALNWDLRIPGAGWCVGIGLALMIATSGLGYGLKAPIIPNPLRDLITGKASQFAVIVFAAILGPVWEELMFRGFLFKFLTRFLPPWPAIIAAAIPFGLIHGAQNQWVWQYIVMIGFSGVIFGWVRHKTNSTAAAALTHSSYNTGQFIVFLLQNA